MPQHEIPLRDVAPTAFGLGAFVLAAITVPLSQRGPEEVIFVALVALIAAAGRVGGRLAAFSCAAMASFSFDFFHIEPIRVLHGRTLLLVGVLFGAVALMTPSAARPLPTLDRSELRGAFDQERHSGPSSR